MNSTLSWRSSRGFVALGLLAAAGVALGWSLVPHPARAYVYAYALVEPICIGALCVGGLYRHAKHATWLVPLLLVGVVLNVLLRPHDGTFTAVGVAAGAVAMVASARRHTRTAIAATVLCCGAIAAALLSALARGNH